MIQSDSDFKWMDGFTPIALQQICISVAKTELPSEVLAAEQYARFNGMAFDRVLDDAFAGLLRKLSSEGTFVSDHAGPGHREVEAPQRAGRVINLALSRPNVLRWLENVTDCGRIQEIVGRVVRTLPRPGDELHWHDDLDHKLRRLAIVINLGTAEFEGGEFELRRKQGEVTMQHKHGASDSMLIFRVDSEFEHRVLPLRAGGPRLVYTGWAFGEA